MNRPSSDYAIEKYLYSHIFPSFHNILALRQNG